MIDHFRPDLWYEWLTATLFVWTVAFVWFFRFKSGAWKTIQVIEDVWKNEQNREYCVQG